jgi:tellurite methyltransferase
LNREQQKWDSLYSAPHDLTIEPAGLLVEHRHLIPREGRALDLACGMGANALYLAGLGLETMAWDLSPVAIEVLQNESRARGLELTAEVRDLSATTLPENSFDLIYVGNFLERSLCPQIEQALRPGGLLFYQTWVLDKPSGKGPANPDFLLTENELLQLFAGLRVRYFRDEGRLGDLDHGSCNQSVLIAQKASESGFKGQ